MIGIYKITSPTNKIYIGQSTDIERRFKYYKRLSCKSQPAIYNSLLKYGFEKHKFEILCECNIEELNNKERYYQDVFSVTEKNGLNCRLTKSSDRSGKVSKKTCEKMSVSKLGKTFSKETKLKMSESLKGIKRSEETKLKMSESRTGKKHSEETKRKISNGQKQSLHRLNKKHSEESKLKMSESKNKLILNIETGVFYFGAKDASETVYMNKKTLNNCLSGNSKNKTPFIYV